MSSGISSVFRGGKKVEKKEESGSSLCFLGIGVSRRAAGSTGKSEMQAGLGSLGGLWGPREGWSECVSALKINCYPLIRCFIQFC